ncbi:hypothetical protein MB818_20380 [Ruegeria sp. 1NDH52C]|uniref:Uncharacterized protein n=1 Tax=Ruegeria alba TaxID=2916756 RepID=A0ABS9P247_9RHOB|nr:hypothetical protein [Ruegeria alba]MCG6560572.1 hypothetical protein [Ruegeria alba]
MQTKLIIAAVITAFAVPAIAAPNETPYALSAVHADNQGQLERITGRSDEIGAAARAAADLLKPHNAAQEGLVLPLLGWAESATTGTVLPAALPDRNSLEAELSQLYDGDVDLVTALVDLYAAAEEAGDSETARLAERMIWHETNDVQLLYPAALLVHASMRP